MKPVKTRLFWALVLFVLISIVPAVRADWYVGDPYKMHYPQKPDPEGWDICVVDQHVADDFMCTESGKITDIHIWFSVEHDEPVNPDMLIADISIWSDRGGMPGVRLWTWSGGGQVNFITPYGTGLQGWACPSMGTITPNDHQVYHQVNITEIPEPFEQTAGKTYWLVVRVLEPPRPSIGWKTSVNDPPGPLWGSPAMWSHNPDGGEAWQPVMTGTTMMQVHDMAFVITGKPNKPPVLVVTEWLNPQPWHNWFGPEGIIPVKVFPQDPCDQITKVDFFWSLDGVEWVQFGSDEDGSEPKLTIPNDPDPPEDGDGWAAYLDPALLPMPSAETALVRLKASVFMIDSFFDITYEIEFDPSPPDGVEVVTEIQDDILMVDVNPDPRYPEDIQYVVVEVEPKEEEFAKGIPPLDQLDPSRAYGGGYHCAPTATAACLKYFEGEGDDEIAGGLSGDDLTDALAGYEGCNVDGKGTYFGEWVDGIRKWIADHGDGYTVRSFDNFDWDTARDELERCQDVLLRLQWPGDGGHALTLNSIHNTPDPTTGLIRIDLMDPYGGTISYGDLDPTSGRLTGFEGASGSTGTFSHMIIICPKEDDPGGGGDPHPGPDPDPIRFPIPDPGKYFVRVTVVDVTNHAATLISIVEKKGSDFGDAPEGALAYPSTCKIGSFPTCMNVGPASYVRHYSTGQLFFGPLVDTEPEGNAGLCPTFNPNAYNQDECFADTDAGLIMPPAYTIVNDATGKASVVPCGSQIGSLGTVCNTAIWGQNIDIRVENKTRQDAYVNVLMDWNKSGEWSGRSTCPPCLGGATAPEHVLIDFPVPPGYSGPLSGLMVLGPQTFIIGPNPGYVWTRFSITPNMVDDGWTGDREFSDGESEDYLLAVDAAPTSNECDWNPGDPHKMHHAQEPDLTDTGIDVDMFWTPLADDFKCSETGHITDIHFWGSFADDCLPPGGPASLAFQVTIYSDIPATADRHSMPGEPLWTHIVEPCTYSVRRMEDGPEDWYDPVTGLYIPNNHQQAYQYNICINNDEAFHQEEGTIYWLEIKDIIVAPGFEPEYTFGWKTTNLDLGWNDDAVYRSATGGWAELIYPDGHRYHPASLNLAFVITGEADPEPDMDWGDAPDPTYPTLAASLGASHIIDPRIYMGATVDMDPDGQPTAAADGDDIDAVIDDEDGVTFDTPLIPGGMAQITVNASIAGAYISVWIDFGDDGGWAEATDYVVQSFPSVVGNNVFPMIPVPASAIPGTRAYVRVRFTTFPQIPYDGPAPNGEVEDYLVHIEQGYEPKPPVPHLKWSQPPIEIDPIPGQTPTYCGWDELSYSTKEAAGVPAIWIMAADDFRCLGTMPITSVHWWGSYKNWLEQEPPAGANPNYWHIGFWSNVPAGAAGADFSRPDKLLHQVRMQPSQVEEVWVGMDMFPNPAMIPESCFQYYVQFRPEDYFWQDKYVDSTTDPVDTVFWISITAVYDGFPGPEYPWGWKTRPEHWMDDGVTFRASRDGWDIGDVIDPATVVPLEDGSVCDVMESYDLAFELDTDPDYIKWEQPFNGLRHWPHYEDQESMGWETEGSPTKWLQPPDTTLPGLHCHDSVFGQITLADDWNCQGGDVTDLHWYGNYELDDKREEMRGRGINSFHLSIHWVASHACIPGAEVWAMDVPFASVSETDTGLINSEGGKIYLYKYDLPDPYPQIQGNNYWLDISAKSAYPESPAIWRWQEAGRSPTPILCGAAERNDPLPGVWKTIIWPPVPPDDRERYSDMAFAITSGPGEPETNIQRLVADDWQCTTMQPVTAAVWWGSYIDYRWKACECPMMQEPVRPSYFYLTMWTDVPAGADQEYSHPGEKVWEYKAYDYDEVLVGFDKYPEAIPGTNPYGREPVYRYSVRLPSDAWFHQKEDDAIYWFSVVAVYKEGTDPSYMWGWTNHEPMFNDAAVAGYFDPTGTGQWLWEPLKDQTQEEIVDMSFILFTKPDCFPSDDPHYLDWVAFGKPDCWCYARQCHGDADGLKQGSVVTGYMYVSTDDLIRLAAAWQIKEPPKGPGILSLPGGICADFNHAQQGSIVTGYMRVSTDDLIILANYWQIKEPPKGLGIPGDCVPVPVEP